MTPRSLVGMTMGARKRAAWDLASTTHSHRDYSDPDQLFNSNVDAEQARQWAENLKAASTKYRIGQRLRPCPGCAECGHTPTVKLWKLSRNALWVSGRLGVRNIKHICDGSGVLPARAKKVRR